MRRSLLAALLVVLHRGAYGYTLRAYASEFYNAGDGNASTCAWNVTSAGASCNADGAQLSGAGPYTSTRLNARVWRTHAESAYELNATLADADVRVVGLRVLVTRAPLAPRALTSVSSVRDTVLRFEAMGSALALRVPTTVPALHDWGLANTSAQYGSATDMWSMSELVLEHLLYSSIWNLSMSVALEASDIGARIARVDLYVDFVRRSETTLEPTPAPSIEPTPAPTMSIATSASIVASVRSDAVSVDELRLTVAIGIVSLACVCFLLCGVMAYVHVHVRRDGGGRGSGSSSSNSGRSRSASASGLRLMPLRDRASYEYGVVVAPSGADERAPHGSSDDDTEDSARRRRTPRNGRHYDAASSPLEGASIEPLASAPPCSFNAPPLYTALSLVGAYAEAPASLNLIARSS